MTETNINLLALQDMDHSTKEISKESFIRDFQEINIILKDLNTEHDKIKNNQGETKTKSKKVADTSGNSSSVLLANLVGFLLALSRIVQIDNYFGLGLLILAAFFLLQLLVSICRPAKRKKIHNNKNFNINEEQNTRESSSDFSREKLD